MPPGISHDGDRLAQLAQQNLQRALGQRRYSHWFDGKTRLSVIGEELVLVVGNPYLLSWIQKQFQPALRDAAAEVIGPAGRVRLEVDATLALGPAANPAESAPRQRSVARKSPPPQVPAFRPPNKTRRYADLRQFVSGPGNELALTASLQVADAPGDRLNPLYLYGGVGNGKTHLLEGIYRKLRRDFPALQVLLLTAETFANYFTQALGERTLPSFRQRFRNVDVLLVDDADFFDGKKVIQEEFLHTFKKLEQDGRQIVVAADRHPRLLAKSSDELVTRLLSGLVCRIEPPDLDTRRSIVRQRATLLKIPAGEDVLDFVAERFAGNVRELEGALNCLHTWSLMTARRISVAAAREVLASLERDCIRIVRLADVEQAVCRLFGLGANELKSSSRARHVSQPRMLAMYLARRLTQSAYSDIGRHFGGRNHATVMSAEKKVARLVRESATIRVAAEPWSVQDVLRTLEQQILAG